MAVKGAPSAATVTDATIQHTTTEPAGRDARIAGTLDLRCGLPQVRALLKDTGRCATLTQAANLNRGVKMADEIVGHKTFSDGHGGFRHQPLKRSEADALWERVEQSKRERKAKYPTEQECLRAMFDACQRLEELGWKQAQYAPADGELRQTISLHSTGIHEAYCEERPEKAGPFFPARWWWYPHEGDLWPHKPIYFKPKGHPDASSEKDLTNKEKA